MIGAGGDTWEKGMGEGRGKLVIEGLNSKVLTANDEADDLFIVFVIYGSLFHPLQRRAAIIPPLYYSSHTRRW